MPLDPTHLNNTFRVEFESDGLGDKVLNDHLTAGFKPIRDKYFNASEVSFEDFNYASNRKVNDVSNNFSSICVNMRSLANTKNFAKLQAFLNDLSFKPSVIAINETYLKDNETGPHSNLLDYDFLSNCRKTHRGGGVGLYIQSSLSYKVRDDLTIMDEKIFESLFVEIKCPSKSIIFGTIYRSPSSDSAAFDVFANYLKQCLSILDRSNKLCFIQGDLNFDLCNTEDNNTVSFSDFMFDFSFYPHINMPTRIAGSSATCIDHCWSNVYQTDVVSGIITEMIADHMVTFQCTDVNLVPNAQPLTKDYFSKIDFNELSSLLKGVKTDDILSCNDLDTAYNILDTRINESIAASTKRFEIKNKSKNNKTWFDNELNQLRNKRQRLFKKFTKTRTKNDEKRYRDINKNYEKMIIKKKKSYNHGRLEKYKASLKQKWVVINDLLGRSKKSSKSTIKSLNVNGESITEDAKIANSFNDFFAEIPSEYHKNLPHIPEQERAKRCTNFLSSASDPTQTRNNSSNSMFLHPTGPEEIQKIINSFDNKSSTGLDGVSPKVLKFFPPNIVFCFSHIFNLSLSQGKLIESFKKAKVIPVHKKNDKSSTNNYRPISLLPVASKILEKLMHSRLHDFLNRKHFFYDNQFGFRPRHSTAHAATVLVDKVTEALNKNLKVAAVFLDMSKAFDCVDHHVLLTKLYNSGIRGVAFQWFKNYLTGRSQKVYVNGSLSSNTRYITCGVPQGSILGPLLYLIYVNDCFRCLKFSCSILYADDTTLIVCAKTYDELFRIMNADLKNLHDWLCLNMLTLNPTKTKYMIFSLSSKSAYNSDSRILELNGLPIERVADFKFLGIHLNQHLSWKPHMNEILKKIQRNLSIVRKISCFLDRHSLVQLYHSLIMSHIRNGITIWHHGQSALRKKIQACANKFIRIILFLKPRDSVRELMKENRLMSVNQIFTLESAKTMQGVILKKSPVPISAIFANRVRTTETQTIVREPASKEFNPMYTLELTSYSLPLGVCKKNGFGQHGRNSSKRPHFRG